MDQNILIESINTNEVLKNFLKKESIIEQYKRGQIVTSTNNLKNISIIAKGAVRQIEKINEREKTIYKYQKDDFLFINNLFSYIPNKSKFIASEETILVSININKFKETINKSKLLKQWVETTKFKFENVNFINSILISSTERFL